MSLLDDAIGKAETLLQELKDAKAELETDKSDTPAPKLAEVPAPVDAEQVRVAEEGHDNSLPYKCPACGATYDKPVECANGHPAEQTLATAEVLAGAPPAAGAPADEPVVNNEVTETSTTPAAAPAENTPPTWPGDTPA